MDQSTLTGHKFRELFYKERLLLQLTPAGLPATPISPAKRVVIQRFPAGEIPAAAQTFLAAHIREETLAQRQACADVDLFLAVDAATLEPLGYYWSLTSTRKAYFHDAFRIPLGTALVFNAFVPAEQRGKGIYPQLIHSAHNYLFEQKGINRVYTLVEKRNQPSLNANRKVNLQIAAHNSLIKFCGRNILSIYRNGKTQIFCVLIKPGMAID